MCPIHGRELAFYATMLRCGDERECAFHAQVNAIISRRRRRRRVLRHVGLGLVPTNVQMRFSI